MELKKVSPQEIRSVGGGSSTPLQTDTVSAQLFKEALKSFEPSALNPSPTAPASGEIVRAGATSLPQNLKFSNHAVDRMQARGVFFSQDELGRIQDAVSRAASKGSKDSLILTDKAALIVSVKNNTVVTVMDKSALKENVFTNIDSTIVM